MRDIHRYDPAFGYRFVADELSTRRIAAMENHAARLCSKQRIWSVFARNVSGIRKADRLGTTT